MIKNIESTSENLKKNKKDKGEKKLSDHRKTELRKKDEALLNKLLRDGTQNVIKNIDSFQVLRNYEVVETLLASVKNKSMDQRWNLRYSLLKDIVKQSDKFTQTEISKIVKEYIKEGWDIIVLPNTKRLKDLGGINFDEISNLAGNIIENIGRSDGGVIGFVLEELGKDGEAVILREIIKLKEIGLDCVTMAEEMIALGKKESVMQCMHDFAEEDFDPIAEKLAKDTEIVEQLLADNLAGQGSLQYIFSKSWGRHFAYLVPQHIPIAENFVYG